MRWLVCPLSTELILRRNKKYHAMERSPVHSPSGCPYPSADRRKSAGCFPARTRLALAGTFLLLIMAAVPALACTTCNKQVQAGIFDGNFIQNLVYILLPFAVVGCIVAALYRIK
jgi:hypothetical protein